MKIWCFERQDVLKFSNKREQNLHWFLIWTLASKAFQMFQQALHEPVLEIQTPGCVEEK